MSVNEKNIPAELKAHQQWVVWGEGKVPFQPRAPTYHAKTTDPSHWSTFAEAWAVYCGGGFLGVGYVFNGNGFAGVDLDNKQRDPVLTDIHDTIVGELQSYQEYSPSGLGEHIIVRVDYVGEAVKDAAAGVEIYFKDRYFTFTGHLMAGRNPRPIAERSTVLKKIIARHRKEPRNNGATPQYGAQTEDDTVVLQRACASDETLALLYDARHGEAGYNDLSAGDLAFANKLRKFSNAPEQCFRIYWNGPIGEAKRQRKGKHAKKLVETEVAKSFDASFTWGTDPAPTGASIDRMLAAVGVMRANGFDHLISRVGIDANPDLYVDLETMTMRPSAPAPTNVQNQSQARLDKPALQSAPTIEASVFKPGVPPPRQWLYARHYIRRYISATVAAGGVGKSSVITAELLAMVSGKDLLGYQPKRPLRVWLINLEDPLDELMRRFNAAMKHYGVTAADLGDRLFVDSGRTMPIVIADVGLKGKVEINAVTVAMLKAELKAKRIDVLIIDPFVSVHRAPENDNNAIDLIAKTLSGIAEECNCAIEILHHVRKPSNAASNDRNIDDVRGASALMGAVRSARVLNVMSTEEAKKLLIDVDERREHVRCDDSKGNMRPPQKAVWYKIEGVCLDNGFAEDEADWVGVATSWTPVVVSASTIDRAKIGSIQQKIRGDEWSKSEQANKWAGIVVAEVVGIALNRQNDGKIINDAMKQLAKQHLERLIADRYLKVDTRHDARGNRPKPMIVVDIDVSSDMFEQT